MIVKTIKVSEKGQISLPLKIREETGIRQGDELVIIQEGRRILIEAAPSIGEHVKDDFSDLIKISEKSLMCMWDNKSDDIWDEYLKR